MNACAGHYNLPFFASSIIPQISKMKSSGNSNSPKFASTAAVNTLGFVLSLASSTKLSAKKQMNHFYSSIMTSIHYTLSRYGQNKKVVSKGKKITRSWII